MPVLKDMFRHILFSVIAVMILFAVPGTSGAEPATATEYDVKAAFIYNFAKFIEWPEGTFRGASSPVVICVYGRGSIEKAFGDIQGKTVKGRIVDVIFNDDIDNPGSCNIIFLSISDKRLSGPVLDAVRGISVVTIGEAPDFIHSGGIISFKSSGNKIRFEINPAAARRVHLLISSQLLRLAEISKER
jgi:hypothetical protein